MVACNQSNNSTTAAPPAVSNQCIQTTNVYNPYNPYGTNGTCNPQVYNQYAAYGFSPYPYTNFYNYSYSGYSTMPLCDCPSGSRPVYGGTIGMGCLRIQYFDPIAVGVYYYSLSANNYQWVNWTQVSNIPNTASSLNNCYQQVALSCFIDTPGSCGSGLVCQPTATSSRMGICRRQ
tara:strand:+ start:114479 stop:115006 length:528 start_codon:yes stop_codon:yes gene_type:complete